MLVCYHYGSFRCCNSFPSSRTYKIVCFFKTKYTFCLILFSFFLFISFVTIVVVVVMKITTCYFAIALVFRNKVFIYCLLSVNVIREKQNNKTNNNIQLVYINTEMLTVFFAGKKAHSCLNALFEFFFSFHSFFHSFAY